MMVYSMNGPTQISQQQIATHELEMSYKYKGGYIMSSYIGTGSGIIGSEVNRGFVTALSSVLLWPWMGGGSRQSTGLWRRSLLD